MLTHVILFIKKMALGTWTVKIPWIMWWNKRLIHSIDVVLLMLILDAWIVMVGSHTDGILEEGFSCSAPHALLLYSNI